MAERIFKGQRRAEQREAALSRVPATIAEEDRDRVARSIAKHDRKLRRQTQEAEHARDLAIEQWFVESGASHVFGIPRRSRVTGQIEGGGHPS